MSQFYSTWKICTELHKRDSKIVKLKVVFTCKKFSLCNLPKMWLTMPSVMACFLQRVHSYWGTAFGSEQAMISRTNRTPTTGASSRQSFSISRGVLAEVKRDDFDFWSIKFFWWRAPISWLTCKRYKTDV